MVARPLRRRDAQPPLVVPPTSDQLRRNPSDVLLVNTYAPEPNEQYLNLYSRSTHACDTPRSVASVEETTIWGYGTSANANTRSNLDEGHSECCDFPSSSMFLSDPIEYTTALQELRSKVTFLAETHKPPSTPVQTPLTANSIALLNRQLTQSPTYTGIDSRRPTLPSVASSAVHNVQSNKGYLSELQGIVHPPSSVRRSVDDESKGCETPSPPYSTWPTAAQEAVRLAAQQPLPRLAHVLSGPVSEYSATAELSATAHDEPDREAAKQFHDQGQMLRPPRQSFRLERSVDPFVTKGLKSSAKLSDPRELIYNVTSNVTNPPTRYSQSCRMPDQERSTRAGFPQTYPSPDFREGITRVERKRWHSLHNPTSSPTFHRQPLYGTRLWSAPPLVSPAYSPTMLHNAQHTDFCQIARILQQNTAQDAWQSSFQFEQGTSIMVCNFCRSCIPTQEFNVRCNSSMWQVSRRFVARSHKSSLSPQGQAQYECVFCPTDPSTLKSRNELWAHLETHSAVAFENDPDFVEIT